MASLDETKNTKSTRSTLLNNAIENASPLLLRKTLRQVCAEMPAVEDAVAKELLTTTDSVRRDGDSDSSSDDSSSNSAAVPETKPPTVKKTGAKRLRSRYAICENCEEEYDVVYNFSNSCMYHPEYSVPDDDAFPDHDENCHGPIDTADMRKDFPESFIFECCDRTGEEDPCTVDRHRERAPGPQERIKPYS